MKNIVLFLFITMNILSVVAQNNTTTKIEDAIHTKDYLFKQEIFSVDNVLPFRIDAIKTTNLEKFNTVSGLRVNHKIQIGKTLNTYNNYIDFDEIDGLITTLQYMKTILKSNTIPSNYTEIKFATKSGFQVMLFTILNAQNKLDWSFVVQTNIANEKTLVTLSNNDIDKLQQTIEKAKAKL